MNFFDKLGKVFAKNLGYTVTLIVALILFLYFTKGDMIAGIFTALCALVVYVCVVLLYKEYKSMPASKAPAKKSKKK